MADRGRGFTGGRPWVVCLAVAALWLQGIAPAGFMVARQGERATIVICTGHGPARSLADLTGSPAKAPRSKPDTTCAFAAHGVGAAPQIAALVARPFSRPVPAVARPESDLAPGRGLAAPPPPSQGPPTLIL